MSTVLAKVLFFDLTISLDVFSFVLIYYYIDYNRQFSFWKIFSESFKAIFPVVSIESFIFLIY